MDPQNLHTASVYVNNLLLSRGLLRNGTPIEFAKPSKAEGGKDATMAKIINLVHDLLLRRDVSQDGALQYQLLVSWRANIDMPRSAKPNS